MKTIVIRIPDEVKVKLDGLRTQGYTLNGYVRAILERELMGSPASPRRKVHRRS